MLNIPQLKVRSYTASFTPEYKFLCNYLNENDVAWLKNSDYLFGFGISTKYEIPNINAENLPKNNSNPLRNSSPRNSSPEFTNRFTAAHNWWNKLRENASITDSAHLPGSGLIAFGSFSFDEKSPIGSTLLIPKLLIAKKAEQTWITQIWDEKEKTPPILENQEALFTAISAVSSNHCLQKASNDMQSFDSTISDSTISFEPSPEVWLKLVTKTRELIRSGKLAKLVLSRAIKLQFTDPVSISRLVQDLARDYSNTWTFKIAGLIGATPEMLVQTNFANPVKNSHTQIHCRVLAGTKPRENFIPKRANAHEHAHSDYQIDASKKDLHEHDIAVKSALTSLSQLGETTATSPYILDLPNVQHLATDIYTRLEKHSSFFEVLEKLHPTAALGGSPKQTALKTISTLEPHDRERYGAPVGWISSGFAGDFGQWAVALRCCKISNDFHTVTAWAGGGIMGDSIPENELIETYAKFSPIFNALQTQFSDIAKFFPKR